MTSDERCARCGNPLPGANPDSLDVCVPCDTIVGLEIERDELLAEVADAWDEGVKTALNHAIRNDDGITLRLEHLDGRPWANPYRVEAGGT